VTARAAVLGIRLRVDTRARADNLARVARGLRAARSVRAHLARPAVIDRIRRRSTPRRGHNEGYWRVNRPRDGSLPRVDPHWPALHREECAVGSDKCDATVERCCDDDAIRRVPA
jgi:hypothetical protein